MASCTVKLEKNEMKLILCKAMLGFILYYIIGSIVAKYRYKHVELNLV